MVNIGLSRMIKEPKRFALIAGSSAGVVVLGSLYWWLIERPRYRNKLITRFRQDRIGDGECLLDVQEVRRGHTKLRWYENLLSMLFPRNFRHGGNNDEDWLVGESNLSLSNSMHSDEGGKEVNRPSVCFQGSGCVIVYHIGCAQYLQEHFDLKNVTFLAASGGSIVAAMLALGLDMEVAFEENCRLAKFSRSLPFGPFGRILDDVAGAFEELLEGYTDRDVEDILAGGRLVLSLTHALTGASRLMVNYPTKESVINSVFSSMNLPIFCCPWRRVEGEFYCDGGLTNNSPIANAKTVRVSPTDVTSHVHLQDPPGFLDFIIPGDDDYMYDMHARGYREAQEAHEIFVRHGFKEKTREAMLYAALSSPNSGAAIEAVGDGHMTFAW